MRERTRERLGPARRSAIRSLSLIPLVCVAVALQAAWLAGMFALWNLELARMQTAADAAALAAISSVYQGLPPTTTRLTARERAGRFARANNPRSHPQRVFIEFGTVDQETGRFESHLDVFDAVRVTIERAGLFGSIGAPLFCRWLKWTPGDCRIDAVAEGSPGDPRMRRLAKVARLVG